MKKFLALFLVVVMTASLSVAGTMAFLQDDASDVNVMTVGNVHIEQVEQERDADGKLVDFTQAKPAYPAVGPIAWDDEKLTVNDGEYKVFTDDLKNVVDKIVTVNNVGKSEAYIRTVVAIEAPDYDPNDWIHINHNSDGVAMTWFKAQIDGVEYCIFVFTYEDALAAGAESAPSLMQVFLDSKADNEFCAQLGESWEILVMSQAVQTNGFADATTALDTAFGKLTADNHPWSNTVLVQTNDEAELKNALTSGKDVILNTDIVNLTDAEFDGNGTEVTLAGSGTGSYGYLAFDRGLGNAVSVSDLSVSGVGFVEIGHHDTKSKTSIYTAENLVVSDMTATLCVNNGGENIAAAFGHYGTATLKDCVMTGTVSAQEGFTAYDASFVNQTVTTIDGGEYGRIYVANQAGVTIKDADVELIHVNYQGLVTTAGGKLEIQAGSNVGKIEAAAYSKNYTKADAIVIRSGAVVDTLELTMKGAAKTILNIEDGATVNHLIIDGVEVDYNTWKNS